MEIDTPIKEKMKKEKPPKEPKYFCPHNLDERDFDENTPIHIAIHACKLEHVKQLLQAGASHHKKCDGSYPVHVAISMGAIYKNADFAFECVKVLSEHGADLSMRDDSIQTPLYLATMVNLPSLVKMIIEDEAGAQTLNIRADRTGGRALHAAAKFDVLRPGGAAPVTNGDVPKTSEPATAVVTQILLNTPGIEVDPPNNYGRTPLHFACYYGNWSVARLLIQAGAAAYQLDKRGYTPAKLAQRRGMAIPNDLVSVLNNAALPGASVDDQSRDLIMDPDSKTLILCHELCSRHHSCPPITRAGGKSSDPPPENIRRLNVLINEETGIFRTSEFSGCEWETDARRASIADILKVHEYSYVDSISLSCSSLPEHPSAIANVDGDTAISRWSFEAAMRAAGSACEAVDKVMSGDFRNAFCAVRPPGHHAGPRGLVVCPNDPTGSHGFCLLNNVAIGAAYARSMYRNDGIAKVAIIDFDVHHGNGTEEIVKNLIPNTERATIRTPFAVGALQVPKYRPWLNEDDVHDVFFASCHGFGPRDLRYGEESGWFYPASGQSRTTDAIDNPAGVESPSLGDFLLSQTWTRMGEESRSNCCKIINVGLELPTANDIPGMQRVDVRDAYRKNILPRLLDFDPDIIFISAGFDGHKKDTMNHGYVGMVEDDYEWVTEQLVKVANTCCNGRIVSVLEGGYKVHGGIVSPFARSVASHLRALVDGGSSREHYDKNDEDWESQFERHMVEEKERKRQMKMERFHRPFSETAELYQQNGAAFGAALVGAAAPDLSPLPGDSVAANAEAMVPAEEGRQIEDLLKAPLGNSTPLHPEQHDPMHSASNDGVSTDGQTETETETETGGTGGDENGSSPSRKRRRNNVDYKQLYEQMKTEEVGVAKGQQP